MTQIFDHETENDTEEAKLAVDFTLPKAGWVRVRVRPLHELHAISCTYLWDPFVRMIEWLEQIADGSPAATWSVDQEGSVSRLQFFGGCVDDRADYLLHIQSDHRGIARVRAVKVDRRQLVEAFYRGFRRMTDDPGYSPREWDAHPQYRWLNEMDDEEYDQACREYPYGGHWPRSLKSARLESYLSREADRQLELFSRLGR